MRTKFLAVLRFLAKPTVAISLAVILAAAAAGIAWSMTQVTPTGSYSTAVLAPIKGQAGSVSNLSFEVPGRVIAAPVKLGASVFAGATLAVLDSSALIAERSGAEANLEAAEAHLASLQAGTRPEQLAIDQTAVTEDQDALRDALRSAYVSSDAAIHVTADQFFTNPRSGNALLTITVPDATLVNTINAERSALEPVLVAWGDVINAPDFMTGDPATYAATSANNLVAITTFLDNLAYALTETPSSPALQAYQASVGAVRTSIAAALTASTGATAALKNAEGVLALANAGATATDIAQAQAAVDAAKASVASVAVAISKTVLTTPVSGTVTTENAALGDTVAPGELIVSIDSSGDEKPSALVIPSSAVITTGGTSFVYRKSSTGAPVKTLVTTGLVSATGQTEITSGLSVGDEVLSFGSAQ